MPDGYRVVARRDQHQESRYLGRRFARARRDSFPHLLPSSYWVLRTRSAQRMYRVERLADLVFIVALVLMVVVCGFVTYAIAAS